MKKKKKNDTNETNETNEDRAQRHTNTWINWTCLIDKMYNCKQQTACACCEIVLVWVRIAYASPKNADEKRNRKILCDKSAKDDRTKEMQENNWLCNGQWN